MPGRFTDSAAFVVGAVPLHGSDAALAGSLGQMIEHGLRAVETRRGTGGSQLLRDLVETETLLLELLDHAQRSPWTFDVTRSSRMNRGDNEQATVTA